MSLTKKIEMKSDNSFLDSHLVKGKRVLPFTLATQSMAEAAADTHPGYHLWSVQDVQLFRGLTQSEGSNEVVLQLDLHDSIEENGILHVQVEMLLSANGKFVPCYRCVALLGQRARPGMTVPGLVSPAELTTVIKTKAQLYDKACLFHGPDFQSIGQEFADSHRGRAQLGALIVGIAQIQRDCVTAGGGAVSG